MNTLEIILGTIVFTLAFTIPIMTNYNRRVLRSRVAIASELTKYQLENRKVLQTIESLYKEKSNIIRDKQKVEEELKTYKEAFKEIGPQLEAIKIREESIRSLVRRLKLGQKVKALDNKQNTITNDIQAQSSTDTGVSG